MFSFPKKDAGTLSGWLISCSTADCGRGPTGSGQETTTQKFDCFSERIMFAFIASQQCREQREGLWAKESRSDKSRVLPQRLQWKKEKGRQIYSFTKVNGIFASGYRDRTVIYARAKKPKTVHDSHNSKHGEYTLFKKRRQWNKRRCSRGSL